MLVKHVREARAAAPYDGYVKFGAATVLTLLLGLGGWSALTSISGAVIAPGVVAVEGKPKIIQHASGGIVGAILVRDGDRVEADDVLLRLDDTMLNARLAIIESKLHEAQARQARLDAELAGLDRYQPPSELQALLDQPAVHDIVHGQTRLFAARQAAYKGDIRLLEQRIDQHRAEIASLEDLSVAKQRQHELIGDELESSRRLHTQGHTSTTRLRALEQDLANLQGEMAERRAELATAKGALGESRLQISQRENTWREEGATERQEVLATIRELQEERITAIDELSRIEIRTPVAGIVHGLTMHTLGGVITPSEPIMQIIPNKDRLLIEARVEPQNIDQLHLGQDAMLRFSAFNQRMTPELTGQLVNVSADRLEDQMSGNAYYQALIEVPQGQIERLNGLTLLPGMPVESFIETGERTVLSYFVKPLTDQLHHAFREE